MPVADPFEDRESDPGAGIGFSRVEPLDDHEDPVEALGLSPDPAIPDRELSEAVRPARTVMNVERHVRPSERDPVRDHVREDLFERERVGYQYRARLPEEGGSEAALHAPQDGRGLRRDEFLPGESATAMFGGNSNWRGPIWFPMNHMLIRSLMNLYGFYGNSFTIECPTGSGTWMNLFEVGQEIARRLERIFLPDENGRRPVFGDARKSQEDVHWRDHLLFYEYFHGDTGAGLGASHQTGWTGLIARLIQVYGYMSPELLLTPEGRRLAFRKRSGAESTGAPGTGEGKRARSPRPRAKARSVAGTGGHGSGSSGEG